MNTPTIAPQSSSIANPCDAVCSAQAAANFFLSKAKEQHKSLSPMQLIKLVYIAHGWTLAILNRPLFDESIEAWQHGPVVPSLYHEFKYWGSSNIEKPAVNLDSDGKLYVPRINSEEIEAKEVLEQVWNIYRNLSGGQLRKLTHERGTPWSETYQENMRHVQISQDVIKKHYLELLSKLPSRGT